MKPFSPVIPATAVMLATSLLAGCGSYPMGAGFGSVQKTVSERAGKNVRWNQSLEEDKEAEAAVQQLLNQPLSGDAAVQVALLNNKRLQASYEKLGVAQAELVQAGLLSLPVFDVAASFPAAGGPPDLDLGIARSFLDLLTLPAKKRMAENQFESAKAMVSEEVMNLSGETLRKYYRAQADAQILEMLDQVVLASSASFETAQRLHEAGNVKNLDLDNEKALYGQSKLQRANAQLSAQQSREELSKTMGLWGSDTSKWKISNRLPAMPSKERDWSKLEAEAVSASLALEASRHRLNVQAQQLGVTNLESWLQGLELGAVSSREDGEWDVGPSASLNIPLTPNGRRAALEVVRSELRQELREFEATAIEVRSDARSARDRLLATRRMVEYLQAELLPLREKITQETLLEYNAMQVGVFQLLETKRQQIETGERYIQTLYTYWANRAELETILRGGRISPSSTEVSSEAAPSNPESH